MVTNRRMFLSGIAAALAWRPALDAKSPLAGVAAPIAKPSGAALADCTTAEAILAYVAPILHHEMLDQLVLGRLARRNFAPIVCQPRDTIDTLIAREGRGGGIWHLSPSNVVVLDKHLEANITILDICAALENPERLRIYLRPASIAVAEALDQAIWDKKGGYGIRRPPLCTSTEDATCK